MTENNKIAIRESMGPPKIINPFMAKPHEIPRDILFYVFERQIPNSMVIQASLQGETAGESKIDNLIRRLPPFLHGSSTTCSQWMESEGEFTDAQLVEFNLMDAEFLSILVYNYRVFKFKQSLSAAIASTVTQKLGG